MNNGVEEICGGRRGRNGFMVGGMKMGKNQRRKAGKREDEEERNEATSISKVMALESEVAPTIIKLIPV